MNAVNVRAKFENRSFTRSWDIRGYLKTLGSPWIRPRSLFSKNFNGHLFRMDHVNVQAKLEVHSFSRSWDNRGYLKSIGSPWIRPRFLQNFKYPFVRMDHVNVLAKFKVRSFTRAWDNSGYLKTLGSPWIRRSRSPKVVDFGTNRKCICDFLLVPNSNLRPILYRFGDIAGFLSSWVTPPLFHPNFGDVLIAPDGPCWGQPEQRP